MKRRRDKEPGLAFLGRNQVAREFGILDGVSRPALKNYPPFFQPEIIEQGFGAFCFIRAGCNKMPVASSMDDRHSRVSFREAGNDGEPLCRRIQGGISARAHNRRIKRATKDNYSIDPVWKLHLGEAFLQREYEPVGSRRKTTGSNKCDAAKGHPDARPPPSRQHHEATEESTKDQGIGWLNEKEADLGKDKKHVLAICLTTDNTGVTTKEPLVLAPFYQIIESSRWLERLCPQGLRLAQLRIKDKSIGDVQAMTAQALRTARSFGCTLVINDHWQTAIDLGAEWLHLGQEDLDTADLDTIRRAGIKLGISTHTPEELDRALRHDPDYIALGPIFPARGKRVDYAPQGISRISDWRKRISCPLVAIGGIRLEQAPEIYRAGADSICVITDVLQAPSPEERCLDWIRISSAAIRS